MRNTFCIELVTISSFYLHRVLTGPESRRGGAITRGPEIPSGLIYEGEGTRGQEILSYRARRRFVDKSIGREPVTFVTSSQVHQTFNSRPRFVDLLHLWD